MPARRVQRTVQAPPSLLTTRLPAVPACLPTQVPTKLGQERIYTSPASTFPFIFLLPPLLLLPSTSPGLLSFCPWLSSLPRQKPSTHRLCSYQRHRQDTASQLAAINQDQSTRHTRLLRYKDIPLCTTKSPLSAGASVHSPTTQPHCNPAFFALSSLSVKTRGCPAFATTSPCA